jgi:hypothetical protein
MNATLENWSVTLRGSIYLAPEHHQRCLQGEVFGHADHEDGHHVTSSPIKTAEGQTVTTRSGTRYTLGKPNPRWLEWMEGEGIEFDPANPIEIHEGPPPSVQDLQDLLIG